MHSQAALAIAGASHSAIERSLWRYIEHLGVRGYRAQGMATAQRYISDFTAWAAERGITHPSQVSRAVLERYQRFLYHYRQRNGKPLSVASQRCKLVPLRGFFRWLTRVGQIPANPAADLELPKRLKRLPRVVLTAAEVERIMACVDTSTAIGLRDRAMLELLYATGLRRMELCRLEIGDMDAERCVILVREGKGGKDRLLPLGERALHWLRQYVQSAREQLAWNQAEQTLFLGAEGKPLSALWLSSLIAKRVDAANLGKRGGPHLFRHTMATLMLEGGADIRFIQAMLGHAELSTTQIYTQVAIRQLQRVHAMTHPGVARRVRGGGAEQQNTPPAAQNALQAINSATDEPRPQPSDSEAHAAFLDELAAENDDKSPDSEHI